MLKLLHRMLFCILYTLLSLSTTSAQNGAGVYYFNFFIDNAIIQIDEFKIQGKNGKETSINSTINFPDDFADSIRVIALQALEERTGKNTDFIYVKNKKGIEIKTTGMEGGPDKTAVAGLPLHTWNKAKEQFDREEYITMRVELTEGFGEKVRYNYQREEKTISPTISIFIKAFDADKNLLWKDNVTIKKFGELERKKIFVDNLSYTRNEHFSSTMILGIFKHLMAEFAKN